MSTIADMNVRLGLDKVALDRGLDEATAKLTATQRQLAYEAKKTAEAQAFAAKFAGQAVSEETMKIVESRRKESAASAEMHKAQSLLKSGYLSEAEGARLTGVALEQLTKAKLATAAASEAQRAAEKKPFSEHLYLRINERGIEPTGSIAESMGGMAALAGVALAAEAMKKAVESSLEFGEQIKQASEKTGLAVGTLSTLHYAAALTGMDFDKMTAAVAKMDKTIGLATEGNKPAEALLKSLGLNATELAGRSDGAEIAFRKFASSIASTESPIRRVELATQVLGKAGAEQIPMLVEVGNNWDTFKQKATEAGVQLDGKTAEDLDATSQRLRDLQQHIQGAGLSFTTGLVPGINAMLGVILSGKSSMDGMKEWGVTTSRIIAGLASAFYSAAAGAESLFALAEGYKFTAAGRRDGAAVDQLMKQAHQFHDIAYGDKLPDIKPIIAPSTSSGSSFDGTGDPNAATKALAAAKAAAAARLKQMEADLNAEKLIHSVSLKRAFDYWEEMKSTFKSESDGYNAIVAKQTEIAVAGATKAHELIAKYVEAAKHQSASPMNPAAASHQMSIARISEQDQALIDNNRISIDLAHNKALEQTAILADAADKSMTKYAAAIQIASAHSAEYQVVQTSLNAILQARIDQDKANHTKESARAVTDAQIGIQNAATARNIQIIRDDPDKGKTSGTAGFSDAMHEFIDATHDAATQMHELVTTTLAGLNNQLVTAMTGGRTSFSQFAAGAARGALGTGLQHAEASIFDAMGLGKLGSKANPIYTRSADGSISGVASAASAATGLASKIGFLGTVAKFLPFLAGGGPINGPAIVGEMGPELFMPSSPGTIVPNYALKSGGSSSGDINYSIDARGTDPVQTEMRVKSAIVASHRSAIHQAMVQSREQSLRKPTRSR